MSRPWIRPLWVLLVMWWVPLGWAAEPQDVPKAEATPHAAVVRLQAFVDGITTMEATFIQRVRSNDSTEIEESRGRFLALRPGKFRWDYESPEVQHIVCDGKTVWLHEPELQQVTRISADRLDRAPAAFLVSKSRIAESFFTKVVHNEKLDLDTVFLSPKAEAAHFKEVAITLDKSGQEIQFFQVTDTLGNRSYFQFVGMRMNQRVDESRFEFQIPKGADLIEG
ncbi:outer membrane lipoprotein carrier protein LolA [Magnetococcus marinus MC-1]|uniref:Outer-membrane lipoprotein carrier protein n=1 Tax=Magnetococcus marinus (strain ATCC BAA-1437 / JCM 17883 / MC-1) TaxID=156889 RepID=A0L885_MAGMM|nr:outer membrane lipoprotein chaperone LolA [Magnetococcus marinus]ABK44178.1 outer membrane lipoprotein carrier protein LolA [Magnetococcus marinus MC-1]